MLLNYEQYTLQELVKGVAWCDHCNEDTESTALVAINQGLPSFIICWNCHDVRQSGVGSLRSAEQRNDAESGIPAELLCDSCGHEQPFHHPDCIFYADAPLP